MLPGALGTAATSSGGRLVRMPRVRGSSAASHRSSRRWRCEQTHGSHHGAPAISLRRHASAGDAIACASPAERPPGPARPGRGARAAAGRAAAHRHGLHLRLAGKACQGACVENPRRQRHPLARGQGPVPAQPPEHWRAPPQRLCGWRAGQPLLALRAMGETRRRAPAGPAVRAPRLACRRALAHAAAWPRSSGPDRPWRVHAQRQDLGSGHGARLPSTLAGDAELRRHAAVPGARQARRRGLRRGGANALLEDRADTPLGALYRCRRRLPHDRQGGAQGLAPWALLVIESHARPRQRGAVGLPPPPHGRRPRSRGGPRTRPLVPR